jgi:hypothetical protein
MTIVRPMCAGVAALTFVALAACASSSVPATAVSERTPARHPLFGLADCASYLGSAYPAVSDDGGHPWKTAGPELWKAAAQGAASVDYVTSSGAVVALWGSSVVTGSVHPTCG